MSKFRAGVPVLAAVGVCAWLAGCSSQASDPPPSAAPVASLESELSAAQGSLGGALDAAQACFADFKACRAASGTDCAAALKACLPAPEIADVPGLDAAKACLTDFKDCQAGASSSADCIAALKTCLPAPPSIVAPPSGAGGAPAAAGASGFFGFGGGKLPLLGARAGAGPQGVAAQVDPAALAACKDSIGAAASGASDPAALGAAFKACIGDAFKGLFADVCERITTACAGAAASDVCDRLTKACNDPALNP